MLPMTKLYTTERYTKLVYYAGAAIKVVVTDGTFEVPERHVQLVLDQYPNMVSLKERSSITPTPILDEKDGE